MSPDNTEKAIEQAKRAAPPLSIQDLVMKSSKELGKALPKHMNPERLTRIALTTLRLNPELYKCDPYSFLGALFQAAQLGLEPNVEGQCYIIPYFQKGRLVAQFQIGYKGYVDLFWRHKSSISIQMEKVHSSDRFSFNLGSCELTHEPNITAKDRGEVIAYYAMARMANNGKALKVMSKQEVVDFAKRYSKCYDQQTGDFKRFTPWASHFDAMAMKTVLKQLVKLLPKSIELQRAFSSDETVKTRIEEDMVEVPNECDYTLDAKTVENREPGTEG